MIKLILGTVLLMLFVLPIALAFSIGMNKIAKVGLALVITGFAGVGSSCYFLHQSILNELDQMKKGFYTFSSHQWFTNIWGVSLWIIFIGGFILFIGSCITSWQKRKETFPFIKWHNS